MNRTILTVAGVFSASSVVLVDSAIKCTALLVLAAIAAVILRRDSAATRHMVWMLAIVAMLAVPVLSAMLPEWRVLPEWASIPPAAAVVPTSPPSIAAPDKPKTETTAVDDEPKVAVDVGPKDAKSRPLFENWKTSARTDGKIPGGRIGEMAASLKTFMDLNPGHEQSVKLESVLKKCDASRDWTPAEAASLLDEIAATTPRAEWAMRTNTERKIHPGKPLPRELADAPWGEPADNGLRIAWLLEPRAETQPLDSVMKSRVLFRNDGKAPVCFATEDWIQSGGHKAKDAGGKDISVWAVRRQGSRTRMVFRLAPGEYAAVEGHGIGVGPHETLSEKSIYKVGCWIEAKAGDAVTFTPGSVLVSFQTWQNNEGRKDSVTVWQEMIAARVMQESPMPAAAADREQLLRRVIKYLFGTDPSAGEIAAFVADNAPDALAGLIQSLQDRAGPMHFAGELAGGEVKFRVTAAVPKKDEGSRPEQVGAVPASTNTQANKQAGTSKTSSGLRDARAADGGARLKPGTEEKLQWGEPMNGLRMALAWPPTLGEPAIGDEQEFYLVVQNVSDAPVRLTANDAAPNPRRMILRDNGRPLAAFADDSLMPGDWQLQPREVAFIRMFRPTDKLSDGRTLSAAKEQVVRVYPQYSLTAEMNIATTPAGAWTGKLATGESRGSFDVKPPNHKDAQSLFKSWNSASRLDGKIPGGVIGQLADSVKTFIKYNPTWETTPQLEKMLPRFDVSRDWSRQDAVALLDELAAVQATPISMALDREYERTIHTGTPLPPELAKAPWGETLPNGLRLAWLLEPRALKHPLDTPLKSRILIHNAGKEPVVFRTGTFHQGGHKARDGNDAEIQVEETEWTTLSRLLTYRLAPGEFIEPAAPGIGVGARNRDVEDWQNVRVGSWIDAKPGDVVTFTPNSVRLTDRKEEPPRDGLPQWWLDLITARLSRHLPLPANGDERVRLLHHAAIELFGTSLSAEVNAAFVADREPTALDSATKRLAHRAGGDWWSVTPFTGSLQSGSTKFLVLPADPDAAKRPRVVSNPGWYTLGDNIRLSVTRRPIGERIVNEANIVFFSPDQKADPPGKPVALKLPDGYNTWTAAWLRGGTELWLEDNSGIRSYDFSNPAEVKEEATEPDQVPAEIRGALRGALTVPAPKPVTERPKPAPAASKQETPR